LNLKAKNESSISHFSFESIIPGGFNLVVTASTCTALPSAAAAAAAAANGAGGGGTGGIITVVVAFEQRCDGGLRGVAAQLNLSNS
jgi:hypothetical protein